MPETRTFFRVQGDPPQCVAVEFREGVIDDPLQAPYWWPVTPGHSAMTCDFVAQAGYAPDPEAAWELAVRAKREALHEARAVSERAQEEFLAMWDARAIAMEKGDDDGK